MVAAVGVFGGAEDEFKLRVTLDRIELEAEQRPADTLAGIDVVEIAEVGVGADCPEKFGQRAGALVEFQGDEDRVSQQLRLARR